MTLLKDHCTFANWRSSTECIGESTVNFHQLAKFQRPYWRKYSGLSPIGEAPPYVLVKVQWTFAIVESPIGESLIGEIPEPRVTVLRVFFESLFPDNGNLHYRKLDSKFDNLY
ncbi:unnamed protein product [Rotaria magnacalcarata]|uniref:Uncharacterized protein n=1 Tax=Rotaria magnacalcarata TaxID=392030 RepID=A0A816ZVR0_9BILA|nr:unnamed protein product [Rotaria magnacalcarata]CAF2228549.1 unnamed protein product [Rotaria magnacalcarata]